MSEVVRPDWRDGGAYSQALRENNVKKEVIASLANIHQKSSHGLVRNLANNCVFHSATEEATHFLPSLIKDLRIIDLGNYRYWLKMLGLTLGFFLLEIATIMLVVNDDKSSTVMVPLLVFMVISLVCLVPYVLIILFVMANARLPSLIVKAILRGFNLGLLHSIPVIVSALGLLLANFWLVIKSGWANSPFLPAFLPLCSLIICLPRENSKPVKWLTGITLIVGILSISIQGSIDNLSEWGGDTMLKVMKISSFLYFVILVPFLRRGGYWRIEK